MATFVTNRPRWQHTDGAVQWKICRICFEFINQTMRATSSKQDCEVQPAAKETLCLPGQTKKIQETTSTWRKKNRAEAEHFRRQTSVIRQQFRPERADSSEIVSDANHQNCCSCCCRSKGGGFVYQSSSFFSFVSLVSSKFLPFNPPPRFQRGGNEKEAPAAPLVPHLKATAGSGCVR
jgi:hypothetical protein